MSHPIPSLNSGPNVKVQNIGFIQGRPYLFTHFWMMGKVHKTFPFLTSKLTLDVKVVSPTDESFNVLDELTFETSLYIL